MKKIVFFLLSSLCSSPLLAADAGSMDLTERYSYAMGVRLGEALKSQGTEGLDSAVLAAAIGDVLAGRPLRMNETQMRDAVRERREARANANLVAGEAYLQKMAQQPGTVVLPSGLQYRVIRAGEGARPEVQNKVKVHYHGTKIDGTVFDSSVERGEPAQFPVAGVVAGFREALLLMRPGAKWQVYMPSRLAYGARGAGGDIGPNETLTFDIELLEVLP